MILLAPVRATGGIATWARQVIEHWPTRLIVIDTSPWMRKPSQSLNAVNSILALLQGGAVWARAIGRALLTDDAVWVTTSPSIGFRVRDVPFLVLCNLLRIRTVLHVHGSLLSGLVGNSSRSRTWATKGILAAGEVIVLDSKTVGELQQITGRTALQIPNFVEEITTPEDDARDFAHKVLYVGRVSREKGSDTLLKLAEGFTGHVSLEVVGPVDPAIERDFADSCRRLKIELMGQVSPATVGEFMRASDLLVLPSHHEGFPMVVLEAMAQALPVAAADVGACREMLVEGEEPAAGVVLTNPELDGGRNFIEGVHGLLSNPSALQELRGGRARVSNRYAAARVIPRMLSAVEGD